MDATTNPRAGFDPVAIVIDWLDACNGGRSQDLLELYEMAPRSNVPARERGFTAACALSIDGALVWTAGCQTFSSSTTWLDGEAVLLDFLSNNGKAVRTGFFSNSLDEFFVPLAISEARAAR